MQMDPIDQSAARKRLFELILAADRAEANELLDLWAAQSSYREVILLFLEPVLTEIGERWIDEEITLAQGYVAGKIAEDILAKAINKGEYEQNSTADKGVAVIGNIEDDFHALGRKMVGTFLRMAGWEVHDLGPDVLADQFVAKAIEVGASVIGASAMMYSTAENIKKLRRAIDAAGLKGKVMLAVGGAVFKLRPELVDEVGGDATTNSAVNAAKLFDDLRQRSNQGKSRE
jgi:methanogenic corrinoid protein MtbC1